MKARLVIILVFLAAVAVIVFATLKPDRDSSTPEAGNKDGGAPAPAADATEITMLYSTEKKDWLEAAQVGFAKAHPEIKVTLQGMGSLQSAEAILDGSQKPTLYSPADSFVLNLLVSDWDARWHTPLVSASGADAPQPLLITPLVFVAWEDRGEVLKASGKGSINWKTIHTAVASNQGWPAIGGKAEWGFVKLGHTDPTQSNSGLQALLLMTMEHYGKTAGIQVQDILDPAYQTFVAEIEAGVSKFEASTGTFMTDMVRFGPSRYDISVVYESVAISQLANAAGRWGNLKVYYPATTLWSDHPVALLNGDWVSPAQAGAARTWIAWLAGHDMQSRALDFGFRPADPSVPIQSTDPNSPFARFASAGVQVDIPPVAQPPDGTVARNLLTMWTRVVKH